MVQEHMISFLTVFPRGKVVIFLIYDLRSNGVTKSLYDLIEVLVDKGTEVYLTCVAKGANDLKMPVEVEYLYDNPKVLWKQIANEKVHIQLREKVDIVVAYDGVLAVWLLSNVNKKCIKIAWLHSVYHAGYIAFDTGYIQALYKEMELLICVSYAVKDFYSNYLTDEKVKNKLKVRYPYVSKQRINSMAKKKHYTTMGFTFVVVGRLAEEKGMRRLVKVHKNLIDRGYRHFIWIVGEGELREKLEQDIKELDIGDTCILWGYQSNPYPFMQAADVVISASYSEGLSQVVMEAMLLAKPVIATKVTGQQELLSNGFGVLVSNSEEGLLNGMKKVMDNQNILNEIKTNLINEKKFLFEAME